MPRCCLRQSKSHARCSWLATRRLPLLYETMNPAHDSAFRRRKTFRPQTSCSKILDWLITPHDRVGLVGANGTGKSTLMKVLAGHGNAGLRLAHRQPKAPPPGTCRRTDSRSPGRTVFAECMTVFTGLHDMERELETLTTRFLNSITPAPEICEVADRYHSLEHEFQTRDGYSIEAEVGRVLQRAGLSQRRLGAADRGIFRRLADAAGAGQTAAAKTQPAVAGRAHQPS